LRDEFEVPFEQAADEVAMLCGLAKEMMTGNLRHLTLLGD